MTARRDAPSFGSESPTDQASFRSNDDSKNEAVERWRNEVNEVNETALESRTPTPKTPGFEKHLVNGQIVDLRLAKMEEFDPGHDDRVTVLKINFNGTRMLTASIDHRVKVWILDRKSGKQELLETFTAHDADVRDVSSYDSRHGPGTNSS